MKIIIDIPSEFEVDFNTDRFKDFFLRVAADIESNHSNCNGICGNYEKETAEMLRDAFENGEIYDEQDIYFEAYKEGQNKGLSDGRFLGKVEAENNNGWIYCNEKMPLPEKEVLIVAKRKFRDGSFKYIITSAMYEDGTIRENDSCWNWYDIEGEWDEEEDCYIIPEGWWENKHYNPDECYNNQVDDEVIAWQYLPEYCEEKKDE